MWSLTLAPHSCERIPIPIWVDRLPHLFRLVRRRLGHVTQGLINSPEPVNQRDGGRDDER